MPPPPKDEDDRRERQDDARSARRSSSGDGLRSLSSFRAASPSRTRRPGEDEESRTAMGEREFGQRGGVGDRRIPPTSECAGVHLAVVVVVVRGERGSIDRRHGCDRPALDSAAAVANFVRGMGARLAVSLVGTIPVALLSSVVTVIGDDTEVHNLHRLSVPGLLHRAVVAPTNLVVLSSRPPIVRGGH